MVHSLLKSLFLYSTLALSVVLAAPTHQDTGRGVASRKDVQFSHPWAADLTGPISIVTGKHSEETKNVAEKRMTNAMRIANGLPPLAPRKLYNGSKAGSAHKPRSSPVPVHGAAILVYGPNGRSGEPLGYISKSLNAFGDYSFNTDCMVAMVNPQLFSGALTNPAKPKGYANVGFTSFLAPTFGTSSSNYAYMAGTSATPTGSVPVSSTQHSDGEGYNYLIESNIWSLGANNELIPSWVNQDGNPAHTEIGYVPGAANGIVITGSLSAFRNAYYDAVDTVQIRLFLADQFTCVT